MVEMKPSAKRRSIARRVLRPLLAAAGLVLIAPAVLLLVVAETRQGRLCGAAAACLLVGLACLSLLMIRPAPAARFRALATAVSLVAGVALTATLIRSTPTSRPERSSGLISRHLTDRRVPLSSPFNLLPEIDQVKLGVTLATRFVPWFDRARKIREVTMGHYRAIEADPEARGLAPLTHFAALELMTADFDAGHYLAYVPKTRPGERLGMVVFLHGNGGNAQIMPWAWRPFAEGRRFAIVCPTFGFGFWGEGGVEAVDRAVDDARDRWPIDPDRVYLGGLSDGGVGVTRSALAHPDRYRGLIYVSPTMKLGELGGPGFEAGWKGRPVLVFQGDRDWSVAKSSVDPAVDLLRRRGVEVDYRVYPGEDHFLFFSKPAELFDAIAGWMAGAERVPLVSGNAGEQR